MILVDTDILIDYLRGYEPGVQFIEEKFRFIAISGFTEMELIIGCRNKNEIKKLQEFLKHFTCTYVDKSILSDAINILSDNLFNTANYSVSFIHLPQSDLWVQVSSVKGGWGDSLTSDACIN